MCWSRRGRLCWWIRTLPSTGRTALWRRRDISEVGGETFSFSRAKKVAPKNASTALVLAPCHVKFHENVEAFRAVCEGSRIHSDEKQVRLKLVGLNEFVAADDAVIGILARAQRGRLNQPYTP